VTPKRLVFLGVFEAQKTISSYSFDRIVLRFGHIVERTYTKILSSHLFAISILNPNYDVINGVISGFAKAYSFRVMTSVDVINDVIMSDADCTPGREPRSVAASYFNG